MPKEKSKNYLSGLLKKGHFDQVLNLIKKEKEYSFRSVWRVIARENIESLFFYTFIISSILEKEAAQKYDVASVYLNYFINFYNGAYGVGLYHLKRAIKLDPENIDYKESLLYYYELPEQLISRQEAIKVSLGILEKKPNSNAAKDILSDYGME